MQTDCAMEALWRDALILHAENRLLEAEAHCRQILQDAPEHLGALGMLAAILARCPGQEMEAGAVIERHLAVAPGNLASLLLLGQLCERRGDDEGAAAWFASATRASPHLPSVHLALGSALQRLGRFPEAMDALDRAISLDPRSSAAHCDRGMVLFDCGRFDEALDAQLIALRHAASTFPELRASILGHVARAGRKTQRWPEVEAAAFAELKSGDADESTLEQVALILESSMRIQEAKEIRNDIARRNGAIRSGRLETPEATVLILGAVGAGHVSTRYLLDLEAFSALSVKLLSPDQADAPLGSVGREVLAGVDVIFNTLSDADSDGGQLAAAQALCAGSGKPVLNHPDRILRTGRASAAELFAPIDEMVVPLVRRMPRRELAGLSVESPILVRPPGDHGGECLRLLTNDQARDVYLESFRADELFVTSFLDTKSADGFWRKYRFIFIDRTVYPLHLAICEDWLGHYWRAGMARSPWKRAEEENFLANWKGVFGPSAAGAVETAARLLDLDFGGMDCALMPDGRVVLFEANASMLVHLDEPEHAFAYRHRYVPRIREAFTRMVRDRATQGLLQTPRSA